MYEIATLALLARNDGLGYPVIARALVPDAITNMRNGK